jgi:HEAT repeat protein
MALTKKNSTDLNHKGDNDTSFNDLKAQLYDQDVSVRRRSAKYIACYDGAARVLFHALEKEYKQEVIDAIFSALEAIVNDEVVQGLILVLRSENAAKRNKAIQVLQTMPDFVALYIIDLLNDNDSDVRLFALDILQVLPHSDTPKWLLSVLKEETHVNVIASAIDRLAEVGTLDMMDEIMSLKKRFPNEYYLCFAIDTALIRIQGH